MTIETATPETGTVDAPVSTMDSVLAEFETGEAAPDATEEVVKELVEGTAKEGDATEAAETSGDATEAGDEADEAKAEAQKEQAPEPAYKVTVNGEEVEVPLSELLKGYSRERDYTAKTMALGEERRAFEAQKQVVEGKLQAEYASKLNEAVTLFEALDPILSEARQMTQADWDRLRTESPEQFIAASEAINARVALLNQAKQELAQRNEALAQQQQQAAMEERRKRFDQTAERLVAERPELKDEAAFQKHAQETIGYLVDQGFSSDEIADAFDYRVALLAEKAAKWDAHEAAKASLDSKKIVPVPAVKPLKTDASGSRATPKRLRPNATRDERIAHVLDQFFEET